MGKMQQLAEAQHGALMEGDDGIVSLDMKKRRATKSRGAGSPDAWKDLTKIRTGQSENEREAEILQNSKKHYEDLENAAKEAERLRPQWEADRYKDTVSVDQPKAPYREDVQGPEAPVVDIDDAHWANKFRDPKMQGLLGGAVGTGLLMEALRRGGGMGGLNMKFQN